MATLRGAKAESYLIPRGKTRTLRFWLSDKTRNKLRRKGSLRLGASARNVDSTGGTVSRTKIRVR